MKKLLLKAGMILLVCFTPRYAIAETITTSVVIDGVSYLKTTDGSSWYVADGKDANGHVTIPDNIVLELPLGASETLPVTGIASAAFGATHQNNVTGWANENITSVTIGDNVTWIGQYAFRCCSNLKSATIGRNVKFIEEEAFNDCESLESIVIPNSVTNIYKRAFSDCINLKSVVFGNGLKQIPEYAFGMCKRLSSVTFSDSLVVIGRRAFSDCDSLKSIVIPVNVTQIDTMAFRSSGLESVVIEEGSHASIKKEAFSYCRNLASLTIGEGVTKIEEAAFCDCDSLNTVTIPGSVTEVGYSAFENCDNLRVVNVDATEIKRSAFNNCILWDVIVGNRVKKVDKDAFNGYINIYIQDVAHWCEIEFGGSDCNPIAPQGARLFLNGELVTDLVIPEGVTSICARAFTGCDSIRSVTIPPSVTQVGEYAFYHCDDIQSVYISDLSKWSEIDFENYLANPLKENTQHYPKLYCNGVHIKNLEIPEGVTKIGTHAFYDYSWLTSISIPSTVTQIGTGAFNRAPYLRLSIASPTPPVVGNSALYSNHLLVVPAGSKEAYQAVEPWSNFLTIEEELVDCPYPYTTITPNIGNRYSHSFTLTNQTRTGTMTIYDIEDEGIHPVYHDYTNSHVLTARASDVLKPTVNHNTRGAWLHGYLYVDYNQDDKFSDGVTDKDDPYYPFIFNGNKPKSDSELVSYTFYSPNEEANGWNSEGIACTNNPMLENIPSFTIPSTLPAGDYRVRFNITWNELDPTGELWAPQEGNVASIDNRMDIIGGSMLDFTLRIEPNPSAIEEPEKREIRLHIVNGILHINDAIVGEEVIIYDLAGRVIKTVEIQEGDNPINLGTPGVYLVKVGNEVKKVQF